MELTKSIEAKEKILKALKEQQCSVDRLSVKTQIPKSTLRNYLYGNGDTSSEYFLRIANYLKITL